MIFVALWLILALGGIIGALIAIERAKAWTFWDVLLLFVPFVLWYVLIATGIRPKSLSNIAEVLLIIAVVAVCLLVRAIGFRDRSNEERSKGAFAAALLSTVAIYAFVPLLRE